MSTETSCPVSQGSSVQASALPGSAGGEAWEGLGRHLAAPLPVSTGGWEQGDPAQAGSRTAGWPHALVSAVTHGPSVGRDRTWRQNRIK